MKKVNRVLSTQTKVMGGKFFISIVGGNNQNLESAEHFLKSLESKWSRFIPDSEISVINNAEGKTTEVSTETLKLVQAAMRANKITKGYFDPTVLPLLLKSGYERSRVNPNLETFLPESASWPGDIQSAQISENTVKLPRGTTIDPGGIGKGLAADLVVEMLISQGVAGALVNANGDVVVEGESPQGGPWLIGIEDPNEPQIEIEQIRISSGAVATSSRVHQTWEKAGQKYHHLVNPLTGSTAVTETLSASVVCAKGADAEALAKIPFILEITEAIQFIERSGAEVFIVDQKYKVHQSNGWRKFT